MCARVFCITVYFDILVHSRNTCFNLMPSVRSITKVIRLDGFYYKTCSSCGSGKQVELTYLYGCLHNLSRINETCKQN